MMNIFTAKKIFTLSRCAVVLVLSVFISVQYSPNVWAGGMGLSDAQREVFNKNIHFFNVDECGTTQDPGEGTESKTDNKNMYILGDSLLEGAFYETNYLKKNLEANDWSVYADASSGRGIRTPGDDSGNNRPGHGLTGAEALKNDTSKWESAGVVVFELGTNESNSTSAFKSEASKLIAEVRDKNKDAVIYWVNIFSDYPHAKSYNNALDDLAKTKKITIVNTTSMKKKGVIHPDNSGYKKYSKLISNKIGKPSTQNKAGSAGSADLKATPLVTDPKTPKNGQSLGGVAGTGFSKAEVAKAKQFGKGTFKGASDYLVTTYGPPWDSVEGGDTTAVGLSMKGPDSGHGRPRYQIAVDPNVIPLGSLVTVWPNAVKWKGAFLATDTGGAIDNHHVDVYDWSGDGTKDSYTRNGAEVKPYTGSMVDVSEGSAQGETKCCPVSGNSLPSNKDATTTDGTHSAGNEYKFLISKGLDKKTAAAITGNNIWESEGDQDKLTLNPSSVNSIGATGIAQWYSGRATALHNFAKDDKQNRKWNDLRLQLDFLWHELTTTQKGPLKATKAAKTVAEATVTFEKTFEVSGDTASYPTRIALAKKVLEKFGGASPTSADTPDPTATANDCPSAESAGGGTTVIDGYAWPIETTKAESFSGYPWPCPGNCHHDNTPAFDLTTKAAGTKDDDKSVVGKAEYAITDGTVENQHIYDGIAGCYSMQFKSSKDGYYYYYTHFRNPVGKNGQKFKAGDKIAEVGERKCTGNDSYPHLHIDRGAPKGSMGGLVGSRDPGFVGVINKLYAGLPK